MPYIHDIPTYWDHYADGVADHDDAAEAALKAAFGWTQYPEHGPGDELLGGPSSTLELGFGRGDAVAALATKGIDATGIDISALQVEHAHRRWGHLAGARFAHGDVVEFLSHADRRWDAIYSIWGALWFTDPDTLLPVAFDRLAPGGRLVFAHAPAVPGSYGIQGMYGNGFDGRQVWVYRWAYEPEMWAEILQGHGFIDVTANVHPAPLADHVGTLIVTAVRAE
ncbi:class I SAM-dependent methyltransferase [Spirillospora sp. CA-294931]|uniref:class I SAM-dependent methyltransferase n=1 Tax=Spirillospora sp. CA-294931 TaxID=3240042 RepID=UPI003D9228CA